MFGQILDFYKPKNLPVKVDATVSPKPLNPFPSDFAACSTVAV